MKHTSLYGTRIDPNCEYCSHNTTPKLSPNCAVHCEIDENGKCKKFAYDPLLRTPKKRPPLAKFTKEDFITTYNIIMKLIDDYEALIVQSIEEKKYLK